jgi:hypothetical protein
MRLYDDRNDEGATYANHWLNTNHFNNTTQGCYTDDTLKCGFESRIACGG